MIKAYDAWKSIRLKHISKTIGQYGANLSAGNYLENGVRFLRTTDIQENGEIIVAEKGAYVEKSLVRDYLLEADDILFSRSGTLGRSYLHTDDTIGDFAFAGYLVRFRLNHLVHPKFIFYVSKSSGFSAQIEANAIQSTISNFNGEKYGNIEILIPSLETQKLIATFLDGKTATIDTFIAKKQRLIQLLEEKRTALINQAVTKGLNPHVPMKDSGIPWIGKIPEHWEVLPLKFLTTHITSGSRGWAQYYTENGAIFLRITNLSRKSIELNLEDIQYIQPPSVSEGKRSHVQLGDLLISITAYIGTVGVVSQNLGEAYVNQHVALIRPNQDVVNPYWLGWCLFSSSGQNQFKRLLNGGTKDGLGLDDIKNLFVLIPPIDEQLIIVDRINHQVSVSINLVHKISKQIEKLQEYRRSLITAAVTGKLNIKEVETNV